jgi:predicted ribonuclease YlaK
LYTGIRELQLDDKGLVDLYEKKLIAPELYVNQYLIIRNNDGDIVDNGRWTENGFVKLKYKAIKNDMFGKFEPRNTEQKFAFDALQNDSITGVLITGGFGSGKSIMCLVHALYAIEQGSNKNRYDRLIFLRNNIPTKNTVDVGALPSDLNSKIKPFALMIGDILGSETQLDRLIAEEKIKLEHIGFLRGRSFTNSIVYVSEAQNLTQEHVSLIVSRIGQGSRLFIEGDLNQCDRVVFEKESGVYAMAEGLKGDFEFGMVTLQKNERSRFASLSDKILALNNNKD